MEGRDSITSETTKERLMSKEKQEVEGFKGVQNAGGIHVL